MFEWMTTCIYNKKVFATGQANLKLEAFPILACQEQSNDRMTTSIPFRNHYFLIRSLFVSDHDNVGDIFRYITSSSIIIIGISNHLYGYITQSSRCSPAG